MVLKICEFCEKEFEPVQGHQKYCSSECRNRAWKRRYKEEDSYLWDILAKRGCEYLGCDIHDPRILVFHHRDPKDKQFYIGKTMQQTRKGLDEELAKCDVLCCNHHSLVHWEIKEE